MCLPLLATDVTISAMDKKGRAVIKNQRRGTYLQIGAEESFLLDRFDGETTYDVVTAEFERQFGDAITFDDVKSFVNKAKRSGLLRRHQDQHASTAATTSFLGRCIQQARRQSPLYFRVALFNPDRSLNWLEPKTRWLFTIETAVLATVTGIIAIWMTWAHRQDVAYQLTNIWGWKAAAIAWIAIIGASICHEYGHGLACKKYGGDVHEMGLLWIFFTPCFFCNVSDAWLLPSRWKRLLISMAGTYVDFLIWILAVFLWRLAEPGTWLATATLVIVATCGLRVAFNLNPLMRMDGYYALGDILGVHNLRKRSRAHFLAHLRWLFWGADRPLRIPDGRALLIYGFTSWFFVVGFMGLISFQLSHFLQPLAGVAGVLIAISFFLVLSRRYFKGGLGEDFRAMFLNRKIRVVIYLLILVGIAIIPVSDRAGGEFYVRPLLHWEARAPIAGFLREVLATQGEHVAAGALLAKIEVPELASQLQRKKLEIVESEAKLKQLQAGTRPEAIREIQAKIERATVWWDRAERDLEQARQSFAAELQAFDFRIEQAETELRYHTTIKEQAAGLHKRGGLAGQQLLSLERIMESARADAKRLRAERDARLASGVLEFESEWARREKELADVKGELTLLEAGTRPEEIEAEHARLNRLLEEHKHLQYLQEEQSVYCPVAGTVTTPRLNEKVGQFLPLGELICVIEDLSTMEAEIAVAEHDAYLLQPGQPITLRPRALPFQSITGTVERIAPATLSSTPTATNAAATRAQATGKINLAVYCRVDNEEQFLRTGMTGFGRVLSEKKQLWWVVYNKAIRLMRTEFWW